MKPYQSFAGPFAQRLRIVGRGPTVCDIGVNKKVIQNHEPSRVGGVRSLTDSPQHAGAILGRLIPQTRVYVLRIREHSGYWMPLSVALIAV